MTPSKAEDPSPASFEAHVSALEKVVADLEGDALSLEASIDRYKEGVSHLAACRKILDAAEQRLAELVSTADGQVVEKPLAVGPEGLVDAAPAPAENPSRPEGVSAFVGARRRPPVLTGTPRGVGAPR
jgi:exodeoxyribonuclease VII small subunit